jgi:hypothetical protein
MLRLLIANDCVIEKCMWRLQEKAEETGMMLAYRTVQYPQMEDVTASGAAKDHQIGQRFHVTYLNAAGRQVRATVIARIPPEGSISVEKILFW